MQKSANARLTSRLLLTLSTCVVVATGVKDATAQTLAKIKERERSCGGNPGCRIFSGDKERAASDVDFCLRLRPRFTDQARYSHST